MTIIHVARINYSLSNGINSVILNLIPSQQILGHCVFLFNLYKNEKVGLENDVYVSGIADFSAEIDRLMPDVVVFHGSYEPKLCLFGYCLSKKNIPYLVEPHGGTSRDNLNKNRLTKSLFNLVLTNRYVGKAAGIVYLNRQEKDHSIYSRKKGQDCIVPNGVQIHHIAIADKRKSDKINFVFLSRIDIKYKGLDMLLQAAATFAVRHPEANFELNIYGGRYDNSIIEEFRRLVSQTKAPVTYHGEVLGEAKDAAYLNANIYVLPSLSEGMPVTVLEALSFGNPCIVTPNTNMAELITAANAGWVCAPTVDGITESLAKAYVEYRSDRDGYVQRAMQAAVPYDWNMIAETSVKEYARLIQ